MGSVSSRVIFGIGVALAVAAISSIFVTMVAAQNQSGQTGQQSSSPQGGGSGGSSANTQQSSGSSSNTTTSTSSSQQGGNTITIPQGASTQQAQAYQPDPAQVTAGSKVTWQNKDSAVHTATAQDRSFDTGNIQPGQSGSATVQGQGQVPYYCTIHPFMKGTLQVSAAGGGGQQQGAQGAPQSQQTSPSSQQQQTSTATAPQQPVQQNASQSGTVTQALQQAGQLLVQTGNVLEQAAGSQNASSPQQQTQTAAAPSSSPTTGQSGSAGSTSQQQGATTDTASNSTGSSTQQTQGTSTSPAISQSQQSPQQSSSPAQTGVGSNSTTSKGALDGALQQVAQLLSQASSTLQQAIGGGSNGTQQQSSQQPSQQQAPSQQQSSQGSTQQKQGGGATQQTQSAQSQQSPSGQSQQGSTTTTTNQIDIPEGAQNGQNGYYSPANAQVSPGAQVTWNNKDSVAHTATANDGSFDTGSIAPGSSGSATIQGQGQIPYYCTIHPWMTASLTVGGSGGGGAGGQQQGNQQQQQPPSQQAGQQQGQTATAGATQQQAAGGGGGGAGGGGQTSAEGFPIRTHASAFTVLPKSKGTDTGLEPEHKDDWVNPNHDIYYTRSSEQTTIGKDNVDNLQVKWILNSDFPIENPPLIIGDRGYAQDNAMRVLAFDVNTGLNLWKFDPGVADKQNQQLPRGVFSHGITYDGGVIFAPTGANGTVVALNATDGDLLWQSASIGDPRLGYRLPMPPIVWRDYVIAGSALGDEPPFAPAAKGSITAFNRTNGEKIWNISTVTGAWVEGENAKKNGGATIWSGGSLDPEAGVIYFPTGNAAPDFNATSRPPPNPYTSSVIAVDIKTGRILWDTVSVSATDEHDWDTAWGTSLAKVKTDSGDVMQVVIAQNKRGEGFALNAEDGSVLWNKTIGIEFRTYAQPTPFGSGEVWPGANYGVEAYNANDNETAYFAASNMGFNFFTNEQGTSGHVVPLFDAIENGIGNGTVTAVDIATGKVKWAHPTDFPTWVSPAVSNGVVFSGHVTAPGKPYEYGDFGAPTETPLLPSGIVIALDKDTGKQLWEFNVGAPIGIGGPSIGHGMLFVTTGSPAEMGSNKGGYIVAFGLPDNGTGTSSISVNENQSGTGSTGNTTMTPSATNTTSVTGNNATSQSGAATESARPTPADKVASNNTQQQQQQQQKGMAMNATTGNKATGTKTYGGSANSNG